MEQIVVLGAGFAGLWAAIGAARKLDELGIGPDRVEITLVDRSAWHSIRVRNYEADLDQTRVPLDEVLGPIGVKRVEAEVTDIDFTSRQVACSGPGAPHRLAYDRLVFALGSRLARPPIPGLNSHAFDVDTYDAGCRLNAHIAALPARVPSPGQWTALIIGGGLTGIEVATEMPAKLRRALGVAPGTPRVIIADRQPWIGSDMGEEARAVIAEALSSLGVEKRPGVSVAAIDQDGAVFSTGERVAAATIVWCAGMQAHPLTALFPVERDRFGRVPVDQFLKVKGMPAEFAAGDVAWFPIDWQPLLRHVVPARPADRPLCRPQRRLRLVGPADAAAADRLVHHDPRSRAVGCGLHGRLGPPCRHDGRRRQAHEDHD